MSSFHPKSLFQLMQPNEYATGDRIDFKIQFPKKTYLNLGNICNKRYPMQHFDTRYQHFIYMS